MYTGQILGRISAFAEMAQVAAAHHEKLDGTGYPLGLRDAQIALETRIITTADIFDAITAERPYHAATPVDEALAIMRVHVGTAIDAACFDALESLVASSGSLESDARGVDDAVDAGVVCMPISGHLI
jgi:HD-GYP domain-containing protein (c-di-GMP phosphodiesterase class II)